MSGPLPKRSTERRRRNVESAVTTVTVDADGALTETKKGGEPVPVVLNHGLPIPDPPANSHPIAAQWYESLKVSGQAIYYEPSDWAAALLVCEVMTRNLTRGRFSAELFGKVWTAMTDLLTTEASRRRVRIEIEHKTGEVIAANQGSDRVARWKNEMKGARGA